MADLGGVGGGGGANEPPFGASNSDFCCYYDYKPSTSHNS